MSTLIFDEHGKDLGARIPTAPCLHHVVEARAAQRHNAIALVCGEQTLTYGELNARSNQLAHHLRRLGVGPGRLVGVCTHRRVEMIVAVLGTLKAGGAYVPLDPTYPSRRLAAMLADVDLDVLLTTADVLAGLPENRARVICLDRDWRTIVAEPTQDPMPIAGADDLAYVIFTSGSTGKAKAAGVHHHGWANLLNWFVTEFAMTPADRVLVVSSFSFDITQRSIMMPLVVGGELHLLASPVYDPALIRKTIEAQHITLMNCSPSTFYPAIEGLASGARTLDSLRIAFLGGEAISASRLREWAESPACRTEVVNVYGAAECSDVSSFHRLRAYEHYVATSVPIGRPIFNSQVHVLDEALRPVPVGTIGEICISGDGVGQGYINDADLTARKFVPWPFPREAAGRLYRTGDLGRYRSDGVLEFAGRADHQVKIRGFRIELGDLETTLRQHSRVKEAIALKVEFGGSDERLLAFVAPTPTTGTANERALGGKLLEFVRQRLPVHMVPNEIRLVDDFPLSPNGKVDRDALLSLAAVSTVEVGPQGPRTPIEETVAAVFAEVLKVPRVGVHDNFFDLGGHSSLVTEAMALLGEPSEGQLEILDFLAGPTAAEVAQRIETLRRASHEQ